MGKASQASGGNWNGPENVGPGSIISNKDSTTHSSNINNSSNSSIPFHSFEFEDDVLIFLLLIESQLKTEHLIY